MLNKIKREKRYFFLSINRTKKEQLNQNKKGEIKPTKAGNVDLLGGMYILKAATINNKLVKKVADFTILTKKFLKIYRLEGSHVKFKVIFSV